MKVTRRPYLSLSGAKFIGGHGCWGMSDGGRLVVLRLGFMR
ncbi:hypothetical protein Hanom_Chr11g01064761 [Helianthus anomalus]